jgi:type IV pilus assembly protein PilA
MVQKLRERSQGEGGFTLVELLVVMLILGLLAAIAIPSFFNQREKAKDADAKAAARTAQTAMETYATGNQGEYTAVDPAALVAIETTLNDSNVSAAAANAAGDGYSLSVTSDGNAANVFSIRRFGDSDATAQNPEGTTTLTCTADGVDGCPSGGNWGD